MPILVLIGGQYLQNIFFTFEKGFNGVKITPHVPTTPPFSIIWKTLLFDFQELQLKNMVVFLLYNFEYIFLVITFKKHVPEFLRIKSFLSY